MASADVTSGYDRLKEVREFDESKTGVKGLSGSNITTIPKIFHHPPEILADIINSSSFSVPSAPSIPVVDLSGLDSPTQRRKIVDQVKEAAGNWGFFQLLNHGIPTTVMNNTSSTVKAFHEQPLEVKKKLYGRNESSGMMYATNNDLYRSKAACWEDHIQIWMGPKKPNPDDIPEICRKEAVEWSFFATKVADTVQELLSEGLGLGKGKLKDMGCTDHKLFVETCYPYCPQPELTFGIQTHSDGSMLTVLLPNHVPGLQLKHGGQWINVSPLPGALIINVGDLLQILSNGMYQSVQHRVLANSSKELRILVIMFFNFRWKDGDDGMYGPIPELLSQENPAIYRNFKKQ